jgi:hypothetical protein
MTKLKVALRDFENAPKKLDHPSEKAYWNAAEPSVISDIVV